MDGRKGGTKEGVKEMTKERRKEGRGGTGLGPKLQHFDGVHWTWPPPFREFLLHRRDREHAAAVHVAAFWDGKDISRKEGRKYISRKKGRKAGREKGCQEGRKEGYQGRKEGRKDIK